MLLSALLTGGAPAWADGDPLRKALDRLRVAIEALGEPKAGEVASERDRLVEVFSDIDQRARNLASDRESVEAGRKKFEALGRDRDAKMRQFDLEMSTFDNDFADLVRRGKIHDADAQGANAAIAAATTSAQIASAQAWGARVTARKAMLERELAALKARYDDINRRRLALLDEVALQAQDYNWLQKRSAWVDRETSGLLRECAAALSQAFALKQIANAPKRDITYQSPDMLADKIAKDLVATYAKEVALKPLEGERVARQLSEASKQISSFTKPLLGLDASITIKKAGALVGRASVAFTLADIALDAGNAGADQVTLEVAKNTFLIGDYGAAMQDIIQAKGAPGMQTPEYLAMRAEMERLAASLPSGEAEVLRLSFYNVSALISALASGAGQYVGRKTGLFAGKATRHINNLDRATHGPGGVKRFTKGLEAVGAASGDDLTKITARGVLENLREADEARQARLPPK
ncbi:MAG: hypothetical protein Q8M19_26670 [Reyranella sp.]|nr:hypothetical protein [Reyranella sp.]